MLCLRKKRILKSYSFSFFKYFYDLVKSYNYSIGNDPGYYPEDKVNAFEQARQAAETAITDQASTDDEYKAILDNLYTTYQDVESAKTPVTEGYYNIVNAYPSFEKIETQGAIGDRKNDGYLRGQGIFYQVYGPKDLNTNATSQSTAITKMPGDF